MKQQLDIVNEQDRIVGKATLEEVHQRGLLHRAVHVFIIDSQGRLFCRQRSAKKERYPEYWSTSVGAHVFTGETYDAVAKRALLSDLGIRCRLEKIGITRIKDDLENEISATYIGYSDDTKMKLNPLQMKDGKFLTVKEVMKLSTQRNVTPHFAHALDLYINFKKR